MSSFSVNSSEAVKTELPLAANTTGYKAPKTKRSGKFINPTGPGDYNLPSIFGDVEYKTIQDFQSTDFDLNGVNSKRDPGTDRYSHKLKQKSMVIK